MPRTPPSRRFGAGKHPGEASRTGGNARSGRSEKDAERACRHRMERSLVRTPHEMPDGGRRFADAGRPPGACPRGIRIVSWADGYARRTRVRKARLPRECGTSPFAFSLPGFQPPSRADRFPNEKRNATSTSRNITNGSPSPVLPPISGKKRRKRLHDCRFAGKSQRKDPSDGSRPAESLQRSLLRAYGPPLKASNAASPTFP